MISGLLSHRNECMKSWMKYTRCHFINFVQRILQVLRHLIIGPGPCIFEVLKYRLFLESVWVGKQELGLVLDPSTKGHEIPPLFLHIYSPQGIVQTLGFVQIKVRHSCNFAYFVCVQRLDKGVTEPTFPLIFAISRLQSQFLACSSFARRKQILVVRLIVLRRGQ